jgi:hypothetical protein
MQLAPAFLQSTRALLGRARDFVNHVPRSETHPYFAGRQLTTLALPPESIRHIFIFRWCRKAVEKRSLVVSASGNTQ